MPINPFISARFLRISRTIRESDRDLRSPTKLGSWQVPRGKSQTLNQSNSAAGRSIASAARSRRNVHHSIHYFLRVLDNLQNFMLLSLEFLKPATANISVSILTANRLGFPLDLMGTYSIRRVRDVRAFPQWPFPFVMGPLTAGPFVKTSPETRAFS